MKSLLAIRLAVAFTVSAIAFCPASLGQESSQNKPPTWKEHCVAEVAKYSIDPASQQDAGQKWERIKTAVFSHANPIARDEHGLVYFWTAANSKPIAVVTVIVSRRNDNPWYDVHELHSLHDRPIKATYRGEPTWTPNSGGLRWNIVPDAPDPASDVRLIQRQAKMLARKFSSVATMKGEDWKLRQIEKPIYQYNFDAKNSANEKRVCGGAVFAYCRATDPESMLVLEVRKSDAGEYQWHYAPFAFSFSPTTFSVDGAEVWAEAIGQKYRDPTSYHHGIYRNRRIRIANPDANKPDVAAR